MAYAYPLYNNDDQLKAQEGFINGHVSYAAENLSGPNWAGQNNDFNGKKHFNLDLCNKYHSTSQLKQFHTVTFYFRSTKDDQKAIFIRCQLPEKFSYSIGGEWMAPTSLSKGSGIISAFMQAGGNSNTYTTDSTKIWNAPKPLAIKLSIPIFDDVEDNSKTNFLEALNVFGRATLPNVDSSSQFISTPGPSFFTALQNRQDGVSIAGAGVLESIANNVGEGITFAKDKFLEISSNAKKDLDRISVQIGGMLLIDWAIITDFTVTYPNTKNQILHQWNNTKKAHLLPQLAILDVQIETVTGMTQLAYQKMLDLDSTLVSNDKINTNTNNAAASSVAKDLLSVNPGNTQQVSEAILQQSPVNNQYNEWYHQYSVASYDTNNMTPIPKNF